MKYIVEKDFLDRFDEGRHCKPGEPHVPPNEKRAKQLLELGFISEVKEPDPNDGKKHQKKKKDDVKPEGDPDGEATAGE